MKNHFPKIKKDIVTISLGSAALMLWTSLFSFNPADPSFNSTGSNLKVSNYFGYPGSFLSDLIFQLFGLMAWALPLFLTYITYRAFKEKELSVKSLKLVVSGFLLLTGGAIISIYFPQSRIYQEQIHLGGLIGLGLSQALIKVFNPVGVQILLWSAFLIEWLFASERTLLETSQKINEIVLLLKKTYQQNIQKLKTKRIQNPLSIKSDETKHVPSLLKAKEKASEKVSEKPIEKLKEKTAAQATTVNLDEKEIHELKIANMTASQSPADKSEGRRKVTLKANVPQRIENWEMPKISLLEDPPVWRVKIDEKEIRKKADILKEKLSHFGVTGEVTAAHPGPLVTMFEFKPSADVKLSKITDLEDDLSLALSSESLRIIAPIPGRDVVGIETSNLQRETVYLKDLLAEESFWKEDMRLPVALGKSTMGENKIVDLRKMPHLLVAGTTGSGKSVFTVSLITGLLFRHSPKTLRMIIIDPKQVDYTAFEKIPHLLLPIVTDVRLGAPALRWAVQEMEKRFKSMSKFGARSLESYNEAVAKLTKEEILEHEKINHEMESQPGKKKENYYFSSLPLIVIIIEEFGDIMSVDGGTIEGLVQRLTQMARACGIHLVLAMQRPSREILPGIIKTNVPGRISFKVASSTESKIILDETGSERLLIQGDMLYKSPGQPSVTRFHGPFLKDAEVHEVTKFWSAQAEPEFDNNALKVLNNDGAPSDFDGDTMSGEIEYDALYDQILHWASAQKSVSASLIQRRFSLGYPRAARIIETFEREGVVGPAQGSKPRQVLVNNLESLAE
jgi:DNA segregation ATPase FtsK/SpoIIIE, S-DNA-T family